MTTEGIKITARFFLHKHFEEGTTIDITFFEISGKNLPVEVVSFMLSKEFKDYELSYIELESQQTYTADFVFSWEDGDESVGLAGYWYVKDIENVDKIIVL